MLRHIHFFARLFMVSVFLTACNMPFEMQGPRTWMDQPLDGTQFPLTTLTIQAHASDEDGVAGIQFFVSDVLIQEVATGGDRLGDASIEWTPAGPGNYIIVAQAIDILGNLGSSASVQIVVGGAGLATETPTPVPASPQCAVGDLVAPVLLSPSDGATINPEPVLAWSYPINTCHPQSYRIDISENASFSDVSAGFGTQDYNETSRQWSLPPGKCYYWRALAYVPDVNGPASDTWGFCVEETEGPLFTIIQNANCRAGPGTAYEADDALLKGQSVSIEGRNEDGSWLWVKKPSGSGRCWVSVVTGQVIGNLNDVPIVSAPESPTEPPAADSTPPDIIDLFTDPASIQQDGCGEPSTAVINATISDEGGVSRVIARIPGYGEVEMIHIGGNVYQAVAGPFSETGEYSIFVFAWDNADNGSQAGPITLTIVCIG